MVEVNTISFYFTRTSKRLKEGGRGESGISQTFSILCSCRVEIGRGRADALEEKGGQFEIFLEKEENFLKFKLTFFV